jgi:hypothetical protein
MNESFNKGGINAGKQQKSFSNQSAASIKGDQFYGDRFIPCRQGNNTYEMQYQHEEHMMASRSLYLAESANNASEVNGDLNADGSNGANG